MSASEQQEMDVGDVPGEQQIGIHESQETMTSNEATDSDEEGRGSSIPSEIYSNASTTSTGILTNFKARDLGKPCISNESLKRLEEELFAYCKKQEGLLWKGMGLDVLLNQIKTYWKKGLDVTDVFRHLEGALRKGQNQLFDDLKDRRPRDDPQFEKAVNVLHKLLSEGAKVDGKDEEASLRRNCRAFGMLCQYGLRESYAVLFPRMQ